MSHQSPQNKEQHGTTTLPIAWDINPEWPCYKLSEDGTEITLENALTEWGHLFGDEGAPVPKSLIRTTKPVPNEADSFFWDLTISDGPDENLGMVMGMCLRDTFTYYLPGDELSDGLGSASCGYHSDTGKIKMMYPAGPTVEKYGKKDVVGCRLFQGEGKRKIQFYRNEDKIGQAVELTPNKFLEPLYPYVGFEAREDIRGLKVRANFYAEFNAKDGGVPYVSKGVAE